MSVENGAQVTTARSATNAVASASALRPRQRAGLLLAWLLAMLLGGWVIARSHYSADLSAFLPASPDARAQLLIEQLNSGVAARSLMLGITGGDAAMRAQASRLMAAKLRQSGEFEQVNNGDINDWQAGNQGDKDSAGGAGDWLVQHRYLLSPTVNAQRFTPAGLRDAVDDTLSMLGTPAGALVKPLLERDPTGETQRIVESLIPANAPRSQLGVWVSRTEPRALLLLQTRASGANLDGQATLIKRIEQAFEEARGQAGHADKSQDGSPVNSPDNAWPQGPQALQLEISGAPMFAVQSRNRIEAEVQQFAVAGTVLMGALLLLAFGSLPALLVAFLPVATGVVAGICAVSLGFGTVHGITLGFGSTLIGEAVDYAIYFLIQARSAVPLGGGAGAGAGAPGTAQPSLPGTGFRRWQREAWPTVRLGLLTSLCGFAALVFSGFPGLAQLGVFSMAGLVGAALATRWVLPALMPDGAAGTSLRRRLGRFTATAARALPRLRVVFWLLGALALAFLLWQRSTLWQGDLASLSPVPREAMALDAKLRADLSASDARTLVIVQGADQQAALRAAEAAGARLDTLVAAGTLAGYDSPARFLPSLATQQARLAALPDAAQLSANLAQALAATPSAPASPLSASRLAPFVADVAAARKQPLVDRAALAGTPLAPLADALLVQRATGAAAAGSAAAHPAGWLALLALQPGAKPLQTEAVRAALAGLPEAQVIDIKFELDHLYERYMHEALWQSALGALAVVLLLAGALRAGRRLLAVCQPLVLAVLITLAGLALAGVTLGILHLVGLLLVVAVGSNYALFFDQFFALKVAPGAMPLPAAASSGSEDTLASLLLANITTVLSFGLIACSQIPALSAIGQVVAPGALLALVLSAAFVRRVGVDRRPPDGGGDRD